MNNKAKTRVVIAGGGTAGWLTAFSLATRLGTLLDITLVESDQIGTVGVGEATIPTMRTYHRLMGIDEREFMAATQATAKLGIEFENWGRDGESYIHSFGEIGQRSWLAEFHEFWMEAQSQGYSDGLDDFCLELKAAREGKFALQAGKKPVNYAFHLNATAYGAYLRKKSEKLGVKRQEGKIAGPEYREDNGYLSALQLDNGIRVEGDFFIDCTGFRGLLIGEYLGVDYLDWGHFLAADSAIAIQTASTRPPVPYTRAIAHPAGWQWQIPLQHRTGNGIVYSSRFCDDDSALSTLQNHLNGKQLTSPKLLKFRTGRRSKAWHKNCVSLGLASGFLEPLESTSIHLVTTALMRLMRLFPFSDNQQAQAERFNREFNKEMETIRDFIILHYKLTERDDSEFWNFYRTMDIPDSLAHRMEIFKENGYAWPDEVGLFRVDSWVQVMMGQGLTPKQHHAAARMITTENLQQQLSALKDQINSQVAQMPSHADFIKQYCPASPPER